MTHTFHALWTPVCHVRSHARRRSLALLVACIVTTVAPSAAQTPHKEKTSSPAVVFEALDSDQAAIAAASTFVSADELGPGRPSSTVSAVTPITIPATGTVGVAGPYPANLVVSGFTGTIGRLSVRLNNLSHTFPSDLDIVLVGPGGQKVVLMSDTGGGFDITELNLAFDDGAPALPNAQLSSGTFAPTDLATVGESLPAPAPAAPYSTTLSVFNGTSPNGTWSLYVSDDAGGDVGSLFGFTLTITPQFDNTVPRAIPDVTPAGIESSINVAGLTGPITKVTVSFHATHTFDSDLGVFLIAPDGTSVELTSGNGGSGDNYGTSCGARTTFDDAAGTAVTAGVAPFAGTFRPEAPLSAFNGKSGAAANGTWRLRVADSVALDTGTLQCWSLHITQNENSTVQSPTNLVASSIAGNNVTFRWTPPPGGLAPTSYILEGGVNPGETLASLPTGSASPITTIVAPTGAFYVRMRAVAGAVVGPPSNEIRIFVNVPVAPSAPATLQGVATGSTIGLAWKNTFGGGAPEGVTLDVSGAATLSIPLGLTESFAFAGVPPGSYTLSVRATNAGGASSNSNAVGFTFPQAGCAAAPETPTRMLAYRIGNTIYVVWDPAASGGAPTVYTLTVTGSFVGSFAVPTRAISGAVGSGTYNLSVTAINPCGASAPTPVQVVTVP